MDRGPDHPRATGRSGADLARLSPAQAAVALLERGDDDWARRLVDELDRRVRSRPLERLVEAWGLSKAGAARLFGVSRQAFAKWLEHGPPSERAAQVADLATATELLERHVRRDRIPAVVRRPAADLGGRSLLDLAEEGRAAELRDYLGRLFDLRRIQP